MSNTTPLEIWSAQVLNSVRTASQLAPKHRQSIPRKLRRRWFGYFNLNQTISDAIHAAGNRAQHRR